MMRLRLLLGLLLIVLLLPTQQSLMQDSDTDLYPLDFEAGIDGRFRPNQWMTLRIEVGNQGNDLRGRLLVRPETTGNALFNTFSTPVEIAANSEQSIFLYISLRASAQSVRVELIAEDGRILNSKTREVRSVLPRDRMYAVVTTAAIGIPDLSAVQVGGYTAFQTIWTIEDIPTKPGALDSLDAILFSEIDTGELLPAQVRALTNWVERGGHLLITGGAAWQPTSAAFGDLLPFIPEGSATAEGLEQINNLALKADAEPLTGEFIRTQGTLIEGAQVMAATPDGAPIIARRHLGNGTVDYLAFDLSSQPFRDWDGLSELWFTLLSSTHSRPGWTDGFANWQDAVTAVEILPGVSLLPAALGLMGFLLAYILLIGPVNYLILSRLNRREFAWFSIPILIGVFTVMAWSFGSELRGTRATLSRLTVVQSWPDSENARIDQLIGLLAPRRSDYTLSMEDDRLLRPISEDLAESQFMTTNSAVEIRQGTSFEAIDFPVDASFIQAFNADGTVSKPDIGGRMALSHTFTSGPEASAREEVIQSLQGTVYNNAEFTLFSPVILGRGLVYYLNSPLQPGDLITLPGNGTQGQSANPTHPNFPLSLPGDTYAPASPLELAAGDENPFIGSSPTGFSGTLSAYVNNAQESAREILGQENFERARIGISLQDDPETQERRRRQALLTSFIIDQYASSGRGDRVYLVGWSDQAPTTEQVDGAGYDVVDTTLYIIELEVETPDSGRARITQDQFLWVSRSRAGLGDLGPNNINLFSNTELIFRFTPLPGARLARVDSLSINLSFPRTNFGNKSIQLWDWENETWETVVVEQADHYTLTGDIERFIGPLNMVEMRLVQEGFEGQVYIQNVGIEQEGRF